AHGFSVAALVGGTGYKKARGRHDQRPRACPAETRLRDQNEYVADTLGNGCGPTPLFHTAPTGLFQKLSASVASSMSEPSLTPAPMLKSNTCCLTVFVTVGEPVSVLSE